ncbi:chlorite dismutase family protein [Leucobacter sp. NPDC077196]|uniref:chlorite dismutase family protein n=1 Tax=Leucobacter sp. NPDC077196 TaxID=3154959 RepID=UPI0034224CDB
MSEPGIDPAAIPSDALQSGVPDTTFSLFAAFRVSSSHPVVLDGRDVPGIVRELEDVSREIDDEGVVIRGWYDVSGVRSDADVLVWLQGVAPEDLQWSLRQLRRAAIVQPLIRTWSALGIVVDATGSDEAPKQWLSVSAVSERPGLAGAPGAVAIQSAAACGIGDADWIVTYEADELAWIVDHLRDAGGSGARGGTIAGRLIDPAEMVEVLQ